MMTTQRMLAAAALSLLLVIPGTAKADFTTIDVPAADSTAANGNSKHEIVGEFVGADDNTHGFVLNEDGFTQIDVPGKNVWFTTCNGVNAKGDIVGIYRDDSANPLHRHGFILTEDGYTTLDAPGSVRTSAFFINAKGQVVGTYRDKNNIGHGFVWAEGIFTTLDVPDALLTSATGINDHGQIVGVYIDDEDGNEHGFLLSKGVYTTLDVPGAAGGTVGQGINNAGDIVGFYWGIDNIDHGFILSEGVYTTIDVPGAFWTDIYSINAKGEIVGAYEDANGVHGFLGTPDDDDEDEQ